jgi:hypothetical protein
LNFNQYNFDASRNSIRGSAFILNKRLDNDGNGTTVFVKPNADPNKTCLKKFDIRSLKNEIK